MIVVTGALGFIGSCLVRKLNDKGHTNDLLVVDDFYKDYKEANLENKPIREWVHRDIFLDFFAKAPSQIDFVYHLGARTDTTLQDKTVFDELNFAYSKSIWKLCVQHQIPLVYASSAATYGDGKLGYQDNHDIINKLKPLNPYGISKNDFDIWALQQKEQPPRWAGLKFFNVYGPNEYHKGRMASVVYHTVRQIRDTGAMKLFRSHKRGIANGQQQRDFIYVKDVVDVLYFLFNKKSFAGLYNLGTGQARSFLDLATLTFQAMDIDPNISFIDTPKDIRKNYQYFTEADMTKLRTLGYQKKFYTLEEGIQDYVKNYLTTQTIY